jgi:hypothetical protein
MLEGAVRAVRSSSLQYRLPGAGLAGKMGRMWANGGWTLRREGEPACFEYDSSFLPQLADGQGCSRNWYEGSGPQPNFETAAPALLGTDESIYAYCSAEVGKEEVPFRKDNKE